MSMPAKRPAPPNVRTAMTGSSIEVPQTNTTSTYFIVGAPAKNVRGADITAQTIAERFVFLCQEHGDVLTNLKLQKFVYYAQAWFLALNSKPLFNDDFQAWPNGPIQPNVFARFRQFGAGPITLGGASPKFSSKIEEHIKDVMQSYGRLSAFEIDLLACQESPWMNARKGLDPDEPSSNLIEKSAMQKFYKAKLRGKKS
jgi:uncharacterized phage-associated protein